MSDKVNCARAGTVIDDFRRVAREHGYAVAVHGSMRAEADIDLLAAPWVKEAKAPRTLIRALAKIPYLRGDHRAWDGKPHGRVGATFVIERRVDSCPWYVDLSIMPRAAHA